MKKIYFLLSLSLLSLSILNQGCQPKNTEEITELESKLYKDSVMTVDTSVARALAIKYEEFATVNPKDQKSGEYLYKAAQMHNALQEFKKAAELYFRVSEEYPDYKKAPLALFLYGFINDVYLHDMKAAEQGYDRFLKKYPDHELSKDVTLALHYLGKNDLDLIHQFQKNQKQLMEKEE